MRSILQKEKECYFCFTKEGLQTHHCLYGTSNRKKADRDGLTVCLCWECHSALHLYGTGNRELKQLAQRVWMRHYQRGIEAFVARYGKNYLEEIEWK